MLRLSLAAAALLLTAASVPAFDFTPRYFEATGPSGAANRRLYFEDAGARYTFSPGANANLVGGASGLSLTFDELEGAALAFKNSPLSPETPFQGAALEQYRKALDGFLPSGATEATIVEESENPLPINDWKSHRFLVSCKLPGSTLRVEVVFLNLDETRQIVLVTTAYGDVFENAQKRAGGIIRSWSPITAEELARPQES